MFSRYEARGQRWGQWWKKVVTLKVFFSTRIAGHWSQAVWPIWSPWLFAVMVGTIGRKIRIIFKYTEVIKWKCESRNHCTKQGQLFGRSTRGHAPAKAKAKASASSSTRGKKGWFVNGAVEPRSARKCVGAAMLPIRRLLPTIYAKPRWRPPQTPKPCENPASLSKSEPVPGHGKDNPSRLPACGYLSRI